MSVASDIPMEKPKLLLGAPQAREAAAEKIGELMRAKGTLKKDEP